MFTMLKCVPALGFAASLATASCGGASPAGATPPTTLGPAPAGDRVLFVGNSLTEGNDLPLVVEALAREGGRPFAVESVTYGGVSLEDHWRLGTQNRIASGGYRFVLLQQGPSALADSRANLREWTRRFDAVIRQAGGRTALYMVWPESYRRQAFPDVAASYRIATQDVDGILLPAGEAWLAAWRRDARVELYGPDGFHPTVLGTYLAALTIYGGLTDSSPVGLPSRLTLRNGRVVDVGPAPAATAQAAAEEALGAR